MKNFVIVLFALILSVKVSSETLKPYILGTVINKSINEAKVLMKKNLKDAGFNILGEYKPVGDDNRWLIVVSNSELVNAVKLEGGLRGFAASLRVALTVEESKVNVTYTNPYYWGNAYFGDDFPKVAAHYNKVNSQFITAMKMSGMYKGVPFGSEKGVDLDDVRDYQYMMGMPEFDDVVELADFDSYAAAKSKVDNNFRNGVAGLKLVYSIEIPGKKLKLYGIALTGENGEKNFMPKIDKSTPKFTAFLPYEILIKDEEVIMLHGRYRIALSFPDLSMGTFSSIMSTPGNIEDALKKACE